MGEGPLLCERDIQTFSYDTEISDPDPIKQRFRFRPDLYSFAGWCNARALERRYVNACECWMRPPGSLEVQLSVPTVFFIEKLLEFLRIKSSDGLFTLCSSLQA